MADRVIDLARDLGDGQAVGDPKAHVDRQRPAGDRDAQPTGPLLDPAQQAVEPATGEARDAVGPEGHPSHDVDHGSARDERPSADRLIRQPALPRSPGVDPGSVRGAWYSTAPLGPDRPLRGFLTINPEVLMARSCAICGKVSMG